VNRPEIGLEIAPRPDGWLVRRSRPTSFVIGLVSGLATALLFVGLIVPGYVVGRTGLPRRPAVIGVIAGFGLFMGWAFVGMALAGCPSCADGIVGLPILIPVLLIPFQIGYWFARRSSARPARRVVTNSSSKPWPRPIVAVAGFAAILAVDVVVLTLFRVLTGLRPSDVAGVVAPPGSAINQLIGVFVILGPPVLIGSWLYRR